jgi:hypothetical protein
MGLVAEIYGLDVEEAMNLSEKETTFLLEKAQVTMMSLATSSPAMQELLRGQLAPTLRRVRDVRGSSGGTGKPVGPPNA